MGGAVYIGGRLYRGRAGSAGEFGGLVTHPEAVDPARQGTGSYERYASTSALDVYKRQAYSCRMASGVWERTGSGHSR